MATNTLQKSAMLFLFSPDVTVIFDAESDGEAIYTAHRQAAEDFAPAK